jgi:hypothetical protein
VLREFERSRTRSWEGVPIINGYARKLRKGLRGLPGWLKGYPLVFNPDKKLLLDAAIRPGMKSFADLGGVWGVDAAYTFYLLDHYAIDSAFLVDTDFTPALLRRAKTYPRLQILQGNFGSADIASRIGSVDFLVLFDVLLHQVDPDWDDILRMYSGITKCFVIFNQQLVDREHAVRLVDLGLDEYFRLVRFNRRKGIYKEWVDHLTEIHPRHQRPWRDVHNVWQWGITDQDLLRVMEELRFELIYRKNHGRFSDFEAFENHAFIFRKRP